MWANGRSREFVRPVRLWPAYIMLGLILLAIIWPRAEESMRERTENAEALFTHFMEEYQETK